MTRRSLLIDENPLLVQPTLVKAVGLEQAIVLQQIHFALSQPRSGKLLEWVQLADGRTVEGAKWIYNTAEEWQRDHFPFWPQDKVRKLLRALELRGLVMSCQPFAGSGDMTKYYRIDDDSFDEIMESLLAVSKPKGTRSIRSQNTDDHVAKLATCHPAPLAGCIRLMEPDGLDDHVAKLAGSINTETYTETSVAERGAQPQPQKSIPSAAPNAPIRRKRNASKSSLLSDPTPNEEPRMLDERIVAFRAVVPVTSRRLWLNDIDLICQAVQPENAGLWRSDAEAYYATYPVRKDDAIANMVDFHRRQMLRRQKPEAAGGAQPRSRASQIAEDQERRRKAAILKGLGLSETDFAEGNDGLG